MARGNMAQKSERSTTVEGSSGGLLPAVEGHSLGTSGKSSIY